MDASTDERAKTDPSQTSPPQAQTSEGVFSRTFRAFRYRDYRLMWMGAVTSTTGTWMQTTTQMWLVYQLTKSPFDLGLTAFLSDLPFILFSLIGGAIADRVDRRKLLLTSQFVQMGSAFVLTALVFFDLIQVWHFFVLAFVVGTGQAFGAPAYQSLLPTLVDREDMPNAIALNSIQFNVARSIGPALAGLTMKWVGPAACFGLNGLSFLAVIASLLVIRARFVPQRSGESVLRQIASGLRAVRSGSLWQLSVVGFVGAFCAIPVVTLLPVFSHDIFHRGETFYSTLMAFQGVGAVCGALLYANLSRMRRKGLTMIWMQILFAALLVGFALSRSEILTVLLIAAAGGTLMMLIASVNSLVQLAAAEEMRGRVSSVFMLSFRGGMPLGNLTTGFVASAIGPSSALVLNALLLAGLGVGLLSSRSAIKSM